MPLLLLALLLSSCSPRPTDNTGLPNYSDMSAASEAGQTPASRTGMMHQYTYEAFMSSLKWLEAEGYIEKFYDSNTELCVRICEGAEDCEV